MDTHFYEELLQGPSTLPLPPLSPQSAFSGGEGGVRLLAAVQNNTPSLLAPAHSYPPQTHPRGHLVA